MKHNNIIDEIQLSRGQKNKRRRKKKKLIKVYFCFTILCLISILAYKVLNLKDKDIIKNNNRNEVIKKEYKGREDVNVLAENSEYNTGYLPLNEDPNAEDAKMVFDNTEGLLKNKLTYPVRTDGKKVVYLTFDDGPSTENTKNILDTLNKYNVKATFFVTGVSIEHNNESKKLLKEIAENGNAIGNHTYSHDYKKLYPGGVIDSTAFMNEIKKTEDVMKEVLGEDFHTRVIRFPGGYWSWSGRSNIRPILDSEGYYSINWNVLNEDAQGIHKNAEQLFQVLKNYVEGLGENADSIVVLMHDTYGKSETAKALPEVIEYFKDKGFEFKTIK